MKSVTQLHLIDNTSTCSCPHCSGFTSRGDAAQLESLGVRRSDAIWATAPAPPQFVPSPLHRSSLHTAAAHALGAMITVGIVALVLSAGKPSLWALLAIAMISAVSGARSFGKVRNAAQEDDERRRLVHEVRVQTWQERRDVYDRLQFCFECRQAIDPETQRTAAFHEMLNLFGNASGASMKLVA